MLWKSVAFRVFFIVIISWFLGYVAGWLLVVISVTVVDCFSGQSGIGECVFVCVR